MKRTFMFLLTLLLMTAAGLGCAFGGSKGPPPGGGRGGPPPEAYKACEGKSAGDEVTIETPRGDTLEGVCEERDGRLVFRPTSPPPGGKRKK